MLVEDYLRPEAVTVGILSSHRDDEGRLVDDDPRRFGFHNLRHSLASFLVRIRTDPKIVQTLLRHSDVKLTLQCYTHRAGRRRSRDLNQRQPSRTLLIHWPFLLTRLTFLPDFLLDSLRPTSPRRQFRRRQARLGCAPPNGKINTCRGLRRSTIIDLRNIHSM
jgi:hypothetical protein